MLAICKLITILIKMKKVSFHKIDTEIKSNALYFNVINNLVAVINKPYCIKTICLLTLKKCRKTMHIKITSYIIL